MKKHFIKAIASVPLVCCAIIPQNVFADLVESRGHVTSIDYSTRKVKLQQHEGIGDFRILFDATIKLANGERGSIGSIKKNTTISFVYDDSGKGISNIEIVNRSR